MAPAGCGGPGRAAGNIARGRPGIGPRGGIGDGHRDPDADRHDIRAYNEVRHAGAARSPYQVVRTFGDDAARTAAEAATRYIAAAMVPIPVLPGRGFVRGGGLRLGPIEHPRGGLLPGEALPALTRLAQEFPEGPYLDAATRSADFLIRSRDRDSPGQPAVIDHWLTIALCRLVWAAP